MSKRERETTLTRLRWMTRRVTRRVPTVGGRKEGERVRENRPKFVNSSECASGALWMFSPTSLCPPRLPSTQPAHDVYYSSRPNPRTIHVLLPLFSTAPHALSTSILFDHTGDSPRCILVSLSQALSLSLAPSRSSPRGALGWRCNERCTLSSSCSRRRCFHSVAQSVSARLPARFALRCAFAGRPSVIQNKPKRMRREADAVAITSKYRYKCIPSMHT